MTGWVMTGRKGTLALEAINQLLAEQPDRVAHDFSEATRRTAAYRDEITETIRKTGNQEDRRRVERVNAVLSVIVGGHYPLGEVPWARIEKARDELEILLNETGGATAR